ncbi:autoinducer binding domain-containing protein [Burkholderia pseudomallei]|uniref:autoinducer binding domain-containing protein n=1 Tax=Burkholderia pseudomallei TaxID=28450 RepID=UPI00016B21D9|nr:autoinducer binding domain-containing protein [Burkholderia pseudomallei]AJX85568.1 autoinducer binding domain protein [Burkholderia pseudomallei 7894]APD38891.1 transcriptional regulator [Burkholderia pseudomallei]ARK43470.1 transcriptional regulator [Burkholderia pseudomallei]ARK59300.1 transcriptional regulator [Burkholderia pseudomallei]ARK70591.1 transcriptional regulator [Burkholderia pseudomallei]
MARQSTSVPFELSSAELARTRVGIVDGKRISLGVQGDALRGFVLERRCKSPGEPVSTQRVGLRDPAAVAAFVEHDPYVVQLGIDYRALLDVHRAADDAGSHGAFAVHDARYARPASEAGGAFRPAEHAGAAPAASGVTTASAASVAQPEFAVECEHDGALLALMRRICASCGATQCFYHWFVVDEDTGEFTAHDLLIGGAPAWAQRYVHQHWYLNDPAVAHARDNTQPLRGSALAELRSDHWLNHYAQTQGLGSNVFFPAHRRDVSTFGLLHVAAPLPAPHGEDALWRNRRVLRGLANEMLEWRVVRRRRELAQELSLAAQDVLALRLVARGGGARHVAEELRLDERAVYQLFTAINRKMDSKHIKSSATKAKRLGLLAEGYISK